MKPDQFGTPAEQVRYSNGWMAPRPAQAARKAGSITVGECCEACGYYQLNRLQGPLNAGRCGHMGITTKDSAWCKSFRAKPPAPLTELSAEDAERMQRFARQSA